MNTSVHTRLSGQAPVQGRFQQLGSSPQVTSPQLIESRQDVYFGEKSGKPKKGIIGWLQKVADNYIQDEYVNPREQARRIVETARNHATETLNAATAKADAIIAKAKGDAEKTRQEADDYAKEVRELADQYAKQKIVEVKKASPQQDITEGFETTPLADLFKD